MGISIESKATKVWLLSMAASSLKCQYPLDTWRTRNRFHLKPNLPPRGINVEV
jgi:hypothetical protein